MFKIFTLLDIFCQPTLSILQGLTHWKQGEICDHLRPLRKKGEKNTWNSFTQELSPSAWSVFYLLTSKTCRKWFQLWWLGMEPVRKTFISSIIELSYIMCNRSHAVLLLTYCHKYTSFLYLTTALLEFFLSLSPVCSPHIRLSSSSIFSILSLQPLFKQSFIFH